MRRPRRLALVAAITVGVVVAGLLIVLSTRGPATDQAQRSPLVGQIASNFEGQSVLDSTRFSLAENRGRFVLVNFFASWCVPCAIEHPELKSFDDAHVAHGDARLVSVVFQDRLEDVRTFFAKRGGSWPVLDSSRTAVDYGVTGVPETFLVDPDGTIIAKWSRSVKRAEIERVMRTAGWNEPT